MSNTTIYHYSKCTKSSLTLQLLKDKGIDPTIVYYIETPPSTDELRNIINMLGTDIRGIMRTNQNEYKDNNLGDKNLTENDLIDAIIKNPIILERPIVVHNGKAAIGRPPENILAII